MAAQGSTFRGQVRSISALIMLAYVICHLGNHILLLISIGFAIDAHHVLIDPWRTYLGTALLLGAILAHYGNALWSIYVRRSLRLARWGWWQLGLGLSIPLLLCMHVASTRLIEVEYGALSDYANVLLRQWVLAPWKGVVQVVMLSVVWSHAAIGIHFWLRTKRWYPRWRLALAIFALLWPALALAGYVAAGNALVRAAETNGFIAFEMARGHFTPAAAMGADRIAAYIAIGHLALVGAAFGARAVRRRLAHLGRPVLLTHANGRTVPVQPGATILETLFDNGIPHASVCGGRARCTTCRVRVHDGLGLLPPPSALEAHALARIGAPQDCRLACQVRPVADLAIVPLLPPSASPGDGHGKAGFAGHEQFVTIMFVDIRGSTKLGESRLPYDVLFLLDGVFREMSAALAETSGHFSQFTGDGLMALYGLGDQDPAIGARNAMRGAAALGVRLAAFNRREHFDLSQPLRIGIGIHHGQAIVGPIGPPNSRILTAIGDAVNVTARLEGLSKTHEGAVIVSRAAADAAGLDISGATMLSAALAGRAEPVEYYALVELPKVG